ncbi:Uncharacterised protein [Mycobacteroides abscessus subsp. abscessus]|uniref:hypothetical protein n=1 Tax=Mycobacteroides abscessus TaxID=36809 RepID=UPI0009270D81|nr:hypothetical protein [Mycobacteroides abscessus]SIJ94992.1 Uncharacterised protein [Mycobacteroides abscessus subsp. abscessus]
MAELHVGKAQRKAMHDALDDAIDQLMTLVGVGVGVPEGPPVGTIARRPDGAFVAVRVLAEDLEQYWTYTCVDHSGPDDDWPDRNDADSWPVIYDPREGEALPQAGPCQSIDPVSELKCSQTLGHEGNHGTCSGLEWSDPDEYHEGDKPRLERLMREPSVFDADPHGTVNLDGTLPTFTPDPTAQQEPAERRAYLGPYEAPEEFTDGYTVDALFKERAKYWNRNDPATTHPVSPESTNCVPKPRTPRVVDRLGVDERDSEWTRREVSRDTYIWEYRFRGGVWNFRLLGHEYWTTLPPGADPVALGPYTEVLPDVG